MGGENTFYSNSGVWEVTMRPLMSALAALLLIVIASPGAQAAAIDFDTVVNPLENLDFNLGNLGVPANANLGPRNIDCGGGAPSCNGNFLHDYFFTLTAPLSDVFAAVDVAASNANWVSDNKFRLQVFSVSDLNNPILPIETRSGNHMEVAVSNLGPGDYVLRFLGTRAGANGISYNGQLAVVPLPAPALLLASALATLFLFGRMRRRTAIR